MEPDDADADADAVTATAALPSSLQGLTLEAILHGNKDESASSAVADPALENAAVESLLSAFPSEVEDAIASVFPSSEPLDKSDFSSVDYINSAFPSEQSLTHVDDAIAELRFQMAAIDDDIRRIVRNQTHSGEDAARALDEAQAAIAQLFTQIRDIKAKAGESESMVRDITRDIKQLDTAKRNLTTAITTLNHLHMLVGGVTTLQNLSNQRQYSEAAMLLQGLMEVLDHFRDYSEIPQIKELSDQVDATRREMGEQITKDFQQSLSSGGDQTHATPTKQLAEACLVVNVLDPKVKRSLLRFLITRELAEYDIIFAEGEEGTWIDQIDKRFNWLKRHLIDFEERLGPMFPPDWEISERIAVEFCDVTRKQLEKTMFKRKHEVDTKLLLHAIQRTANFEALLSRRFTGVTLQQFQEFKKEEEREKKKEESAKNPFENPEEEKIDDPNNPFFEEGGVKDVKKKNNVAPQADVTTPFAGIISQCFEPYLSIYINTQDTNLSQLVERASLEQRNRGCANLAAEGSAVLHSCGDLFMFYKKCMVQCAQLSTGEPLLELAKVFKKYLREYATTVLIGNLPKSAATSSLTLSMTKVTKELKDFSTSGLIQNFQSLLKEGDGASVRLSDDEKVLVCTFLVTSEYCLETTQQLEGKLKEKVDPELASQINLGAEQDVYHSVINSCLQLLVAELDDQCCAPMVTMSKMAWSTVESVGDQSAYVTALVNHMKQCVPLVRDNLASSKKYFTQFCVKFVNAFIPKFIQHLYRCKPISPVGAEQLLLDTHSIKTLLLDLPSVGSKVSARKAPASYTKIVVKGMTRAEMTLKVVMSHADPVSAFVEQCIKLVPDIDLGEFQRVLDMKGVRKVDQMPFMEQFKAVAPASATGPMAAMLSPAHGAAVAGSGAVAAKAGEESKIKKLENMIKKRL